MRAARNNNDRMPFASFLSTRPDLASALREVTDGPWTGDADLVVAFLSPHHVTQAEAIAQALTQRFAPKALVGCSAESIAGNDQEIEEAPALVVWVARFAHADRVVPFCLTYEQTADGMSVFGLPDELDDAAPADAVLLTFADPFSFPIDDFLQQLNEEKPGLAVAGGMASASRHPGGNRLLFGTQTPNEGAVGVLLEGKGLFRTVVSQGCRPIGKPFVVTKANQNLILELGGRPALEAIQKLWSESPPFDQALIQSGLHVGRVVSELQDTFQRGDFLVRNVMGVDQETGGIAITDRVRAGQTVQFHVRDAATADEDLRVLLQTPGPASAAALLFTCNGRGTRLFDRPHHDASTVRSLLGPIPLAGFFAMGELGPIGRRNFIHGFTASLLLFRE